MRGIWRQHHSRRPRPRRAERAAPRVAAPRVAVGFLALALAAGLLLSVACQSAAPVDAPLPRARRARFPVPPAYGGRTLTDNFVVILSVDPRPGESRAAAVSRARIRARTKVLQRTRNAIAATIGTYVARVYPQGLWPYPPEVAKTRQAHAVAEALAEAQGSLALIAGPETGGAIVGLVSIPATLAAVETALGWLFAPLGSVPVVRAELQALLYAHAGFEFA